MKRKRMIGFAAVILLLIWAAAITYLHYWQLTGRYLSDSGAHLDAWMNNASGTYSYVSNLFVWCYKQADKYGWAFCHTTFQVLGVFSLAYLVNVIYTKDHAERKSWPVYLIAGMICIVEMPLKALIPVSTFSAALSSAIYYNVTYSAMLPFAMFAVAFYIKAWPEHKSIQWKYYAAYTVALAIATAAKPSFLLGFAPALLLILIVDFFRTRMRNVLQEIVIGCSVFPSLYIAMNQAGQVFDSESHIIFYPFAVWQIFSNKLHFLQQTTSLVFVVLVLFFWFRELKKKYWIREAGLIFLVGWGEGLLLAESGERFYDGNVTWTTYGCFTVFFAAMLAVWLRHAGNYAEETDPEKKKILISGIALLLHTVAGVFYLVQLLMGSSI